MLHPPNGPPQIAHGPQSSPSAQLIRARLKFEPPQPQRPFMHFLNAWLTSGIPSILRDRNHALQIV